MDNRIAAGLKKDIKRLVRMVENIEAEESLLQRQYGDCVKGSIRATRKLDAISLKSVLKYLGVV